MRREFLSIWAVVFVAAACGKDPLPRERPPAVAPPVPQPRRIASVAVSSEHACALTTEGEVFCWGANRDGQLGAGNTLDQTTPSLVPGVTNVATIAVGGSRTFAVGRDGTVSAWGCNSNAGLGTGTGGYGTPDPNPQPQALTGIADAEKVFDVGPNGCLLRRDGTVACWGGRDRSPVSMYADLGPIAKIQGSHSRNTCILTRMGRVHCAGDNYYGDVGDGGSVVAGYPHEVPGLTDVVDISVGAGRACAVRADGTVLCWGENFGGSLGVGSSEDAVRTPTLVPELSDASSVSLGAASICALRRTGSVWCWGDVANWFGPQTAENPEPIVHPREVPGVSDIATLAQVSSEYSGTNTMCAVTRQGRLVCWGANQRGQRGNGTTTAAEGTNVVSFPGRPPAPVRR